MTVATSSLQRGERGGCINYVCKYWKFRSSVYFIEAQSHIIYTLGLGSK